MKSRLTPRFEETECMMMSFPVTELREIGLERNNGSNFGNINTHRKSRSDNYQVFRIKLEIQLCEIEYLTQSRIL